MVNTSEQSVIKKGGHVPKLIEMDPNVTIFEQMNDTGGAVVLINKFNLDSEEIDQFLSAWSADAAVMKRQPGFISTQLHRGIAGSSVFINYAIWESTDHFRRAFNNPEFQSKLKDYPPSVVGSPHLFRKVAVPGICLE
jgi:heme-degrading monooxygenase HmoA